MASDDPRSAKKAALYGELLKYTQNVDYDRSLKSCNRILHEFPEEIAAFKTKVVCYIHLQKFEEALEVMSKNPKFCSDLGYEKSYCHYRLHRIAEAKVALEESKENSARNRELMAQILYRLEKYEECLEMYKDVTKDSEDDFDEERQTNMSAIVAALYSTGSKTKAALGKSAMYENMYNKGCVLSAQRKWNEAEEMLVIAEASAVETLRDDGMGEDEIQDEINILMLQRAYVLQMMGRQKESLGLYSKVVKAKPSDPGLTAVASNNVLCINRDQNIFESKKRIKAMTADQVEQKLTRIQKRDMLLNQALFYFYTQLEDSCKEACNELKKAFPEMQDQTVMIQIAQATRTESVASAQKLVASVAEKNGNMKCVLQLLVAQQLLRDKKREQAIQLLKSLGQDYYRPGVLSAVVTLYQADNNIKEAAKTLADCVNFYRTSSSDKATMNMMWRQAANFTMQEGDHESAVKSLEELRRISPDDLFTLAQLIVAYAQYDIVKAQQLSKQLPKTSKVKCDMTVLESPNWMTSVKTMKKAKKETSSTPSSPIKESPMSTKSPASSENVIVKVKKARKKKSKLPQNYDPNRNPDSERWLPRYERTSFRPKKVRRGRVDVMKGTQGATSEQSALYDMTAKSTAPQEESTVKEVASPWKKDAKKKKKKR